MIERNGDVFTTDAIYIGHGVNICGVMGAGIAKTIREKFPQVYKEYKAVCEHGNDNIQLGLGWWTGDFFAYPENGKVIVNFSTQEKPGPDATYEAVFSSLFKFSKQAAHPKKIEKNGNIIAIPEIGCGIGGLEWPVVELIIEAVEAAVPEIEYEVWHYAPN